MAKGIREKIKLASTAGTGHFYTTTKNKRNQSGKMEMSKYDPVARKHVIYKETKLKEFRLWVKTEASASVFFAFEKRP